MTIKRILITGATDGIGLETARRLSREGHHLLIHGRNAEKLDAVHAELNGLPGSGQIERYQADLSDLDAVASLAEQVTARHAHLDVLINNAGVFKTGSPITPAGMDARFVVNTLAPYLLTRRLLPLFDAGGRIVNLSSAAQSPVDPNALAGQIHLAEDFTAYAQSKLAITMWSRLMAEELQPYGPLVVAVNPGSLLGSKMVKEGFGVAGGDIGIGADILCRAALDDGFTDASGKYFDNDARQFAAPHGDALDDAKSRQVVSTIESVLQTAGYPV